MGCDSIQILHFRVRHVPKQKSLGMENQALRQPPWFKHLNNKNINLTGGHPLPFPVILQ